jgi:hypothetical protein
MKRTPAERRNPPAIVIRFELERCPVVYADAQHQGDVERLFDWIERGRPDLGRLLAPLLEQDRKAA